MIGAATLPLPMPSTAPSGPTTAQKMALLQTAGASSSPPAASNWEDWASSGNAAPPSSMGGSDASAPMSSGGSSPSPATDAGFSGSPAPGGMAPPDAAGMNVVKAAIADPTAGQGSTSTTSGGGPTLGSSIMGLLGTAGVIAAGAYGGPIAGLAASAANSTLEPALFGKA